MNPLLFIFSGGFVTLILCISVLLSFLVGFKVMVGYWCFFIGWLLVGHGWQIGPVSINMLLIWIIGFTFSAWAGMRWVSLKLNHPLNVFENVIVWTITFLIIFFGWFLIGHGLMFLATDFFMVDITGLQWFLDFYERYDIILDTVLALPTIILVYFTVVKNYMKYRG